MSFLLDTHAWIWAQLEPERLSARAAALIGDPGGRACLSPVTFHEVLLLAERGRIRLELPAREWIRTSLARRPMVVLDVTTDIAIGARHLVGFHNQDPFDRFLLATACVHRIPIVTRDESMTEWGGIEVIW